MSIPGWSDEMIKRWTEAQQKYWGNLMGVSEGFTGNAELGVDELLKKQHDMVRENEDLKNEVAELKKRLSALGSPESATVAKTPIANGAVLKAKSSDKKSTQPDNLTRIKGLEPKMYEKLIDAGIHTFDQLAALSDDQAQALDKQLDARGRLVRENWVGQAGGMSGRKLA